MFDQYKRSKLVIILYQSNNTGGAWRSIMTYYRNAELNGERVKLINRGNRRTFRQAIAAILAAPRLLLNGLDSFFRWEAIGIGLLRRNTLIYLHETDYMLDQFQENSPLRYFFVKRILKHNPIMAVSDQAAALYRKRFSAEKVFVTYECLPASPALSDSKLKKICMVGTIDERKGASFFSRLADRSLEAGHPWDFHWIGSKGSQETCYLSENVKWWGWQDGPRGFVKQCDLFFLASVDDPFPLACLEALQDHVRSVAFEKTGVSEVLRDLSGCAVFPDYEADAALAAIQKAMETELDTAEVDRLMKEQIEVPAFRNRMDKILSGIAKQGSEEQRVAGQKEIVLNSLDLPENR